MELVHLETGEVISTSVITKAEPQHRNFIISTWLKSYRGQAKRQGIQELYDAHEPGIAESRWQDSLVVTDDGGFTVYAWVCGQQGSLWYVYVVPELRLHCLSAALIELACGALPDLARPWPYKTRLRINPYLLTEKHG